MSFVGKIGGLFLCLLVISSTRHAASMELNLEATLPDNAAPEAAKAYKEGMRLLESDKELNRAEQLFRKAASFELPQADYALACTIYRSHDQGRAQEAFAHAKYAAEHNVVEAIALLASYYQKGFGTPVDTDRWEDTSEEYRKARRVTNKSKTNPLSIVMLGQCGPAGDIYEPATRVPTLKLVPLPNPTVIFPDQQ